jgi:hypothetical protein
VIEKAFIPYRGNAVLPADPCESEVLKLPLLRSPRLNLFLWAKVKPESLIGASSPWAKALDVRPIISFQAVFAELQLHDFLHHL